MRAAFAIRPGVTWGEGGQIAPARGHKALDPLENPRRKIRTLVISPSRRKPFSPPRRDQPFALPARPGFLNRALWIETGIHGISEKARKENFLWKCALPGGLGKNFSANRTRKAFSACREFEKMVFSIPLFSPGEFLCQTWGFSRPGEFGGHLPPGAGACFLCGPRETARKRASGNS